MSASGRSSSSISRQFNFEAPKGLEDLFSSDYVAEVLTDASDELIKNFLNPPVSTPNLYILRDYHHEQEIDSTSHRLKHLIETTKPDMKKRSRSGLICIIENISPAYIGVLGPSWNIHSDFFADHGHIESDAQTWLNSLNQKEAKGLDEDRIHLDGLIMHQNLECGVGGDELALDSTTNIFPRYCIKSKSRTIRSGTHISYYRVRKDLYLFLVDASPKFVSCSVDVLQKPGFEVRLFLGRSFVDLPQRFEDRYDNIFDSVRRILWDSRARNLLFDNWNNGIMPGPAMAHMFSSIMWVVNLRHLKAKIHHISFRDLRDPREGTNDELHDAREDLEYIHSSAARTLRSIPSEVTDLFQNFPLDVNPVEILGHTLDDVEKLQSFLIDTFQLLMSSLTVRESRLNMEQAKLSAEQARRNAWLTQLASIYLPLSVVTSIFGMNLQEINGGPRFWWVILVLIVLMGLTAGIYYGLRVLERKREERKAMKDMAEGEPEKEDV